MSLRDFRLDSMGGLESCEIDIRPLTILCGRNNTGKTWAMYSIYHVMNSTNIVKTKEVSELSERLKQNGVEKFNIVAWVRTHGKKFLSSVNRSLSRELSSIFSDRLGTFDKSHISWDVSVEQIAEALLDSQIQNELVMGKKTRVSIMKEKGDEELSISLFDDSFPELETFLHRVITDIFTSPVNAQNVFLIPAERNGLHLFYKELANKRNALLHHASQDKIDLNKLLEDVLSTRYAKPIADYIDWLNELPSLQKKGKTEFHHLAEKIKRNILGGKYKITDKNEITFTPRKKRNGPETKSMGLHLASSTIKSLFGIWCYLEFSARENDVLMIDEPELNLHPQNQRELARVIVELINSGINVVISTHSDYLIRELNTLIMLSKDSKAAKKLRRSLGIETSQILKPGDVTAYLFGDGTATKMHVDGDVGIEATTFDDVILEINEINSRVFSELTDY